MTSTDDLVAAFLAKGGTVRKLSEGERAMDARAMRQACGYEPESVRVWACYLIGEDGVEFVVKERGERRDDAREKVKRAYPESHIVRIK